MVLAEPLDGLGACSESRRAELSPLSMSMDEHFVPSASPCNLPLITVANADLTSVSLQPDRSREVNDTLRATAEESAERAAKIDAIKIITSDAKGHNVGNRG